MLQVSQADLELCCDFGLRRSAAQSSLAVQDGLLEAPPLPAKRSRTPVHLAKAVEYGSSNPELGVVLELDVFAGVKFPHGVHQAKNPGVHQILKQHLRGQSIVNAARDVLHLREMVEQEPLALRLIQLHDRCRCLLFYVVQIHSPGPPARMSLSDVTKRSPSIARISS